MEASNSNRIHKDKPKSESIGQGKRAGVAEVPTECTFQMLWQTPINWSQGCWSSGTFMRRARFACVLAGLPLTAEPPVQLCVIQWESQLSTLSVAFVPFAFVS